MSTKSAPYLHLTSATHTGRNILFGIDKKRAIYYSVQRAEPKVEFLYYRLDGIDRGTLKAQGLDVGDKLNDILGKQYTTQATYIAALEQRLTKAVVEKHQSKLLAVANHTKTENWHDWRFLQLPNEKPDTSVEKREKADGIHPLMCSVYNSHKDSALAGVQAISDGERLYVLRQSVRGTLLVDRFVLDLETSRLNRSLEVRYRRSRKRYEPVAATGPKVLDSCDFRDADGQFFLAPSLELRQVSNLENGNFAAVVVPTIDHERARWHIFAWDTAAKHFRVTSFQSTADGIDLYDQTVVEGAAAAPKYRQVPGLLTTKLELLGPDNQALTPTAPPSATCYDVHREVEGPDGNKQLLRVSKRVMLAVPTGDDGKVATATFAVATDGTLSRVSQAGVDQLRLEKNETILLPADLLDRVDSRASNSVESPAPVQRQGLNFGPQSLAETTGNIVLKNRSFTIEFWARRQGAQRHSFILHQGSYFEHKCLHVGFRDNGMFTFAFYSDDLNTAAGLADSQWHHWCCTYDVTTGTRCIYRDGTKVASDKARSPFLGDGVMNIGRSGTHYFEGDLTDFRIWACARTEAEVKANLQARMSGREYQLMVFWPLQGVEGGRVRDRGIHGVDLAVKEVYPAIRTISRHLKDGKTPVTNFESQVLVAAAQRSTYLESVDFKGDAGGIEFLYWGHLLDGSKLAKQGVTAHVTDLGHGWKRASARFTAPRGLTQLRAFDLRVLGNWSQLLLRNHRLQRLQSTVTERTYTEKLKLPVVAGEHAKHIRERGALAGMEQEVARLQQQHALRVAALARSPAQNNQAISDKRRQVQELSNRANAATSARVEMERSLTYGGTLAIRGNNGHNNQYLSLQGQDVHCNRQQDGAWEHFVIHSAGNPAQEGVVRYGDLVGLRGHTGKYFIAANASWSKTHYYWLRAEFPHIKSYEAFQILNPDNLNDRSAIPRNGAICLLSYRSDHGRKFVQTASGGQWWGNVWCEGETVTNMHRWAAAHRTQGPGFARVRDQETQAKSALSRAQAELANLEKVAADAASRRQQLESERDAYANKLKAAESRLANATGKLGTMASTYAMHTLTPAGRKDTVTGALLGFARTYVRPQVRESMEGAVHLSFPDSGGRLRTCNYDAVSDQWQRVDRGASLRLAHTQAVIPHNSRYQMTAVTIEVWFKWEGHGSELGFLTAKGTEELEVHVGGANRDAWLRFIPTSGIYIDTDTNELVPGQWVHVACVYGGTPGTGEIYVNGVCKTHRRTNLNYTPKSTTQPLLLGSRPGNVGQLRGQMQELRLWDVALTGEEIRAGMHFQATGDEPGLVGYWPLTEGTGTVLHDHSSAKNHGQLGTAKFFPSNTPMGRVPTKAMVFAANHKVTGLPAIDVANKSFTVELWARCDTLHPGLQGLVFQGSNGRDSCLHLVFMPNNKFSFRFWANDLDVATPTDTSWHHWACVYDREHNLRTIYCDGQQVAQDRPPSMYRGSGAFELGHYQGSSLVGQMADVRVWSEARSPAQIRQHMHLRLRGDEPRLLGYWQLDGVVEGKLRGKDGSVQGAVVGATSEVAPDLPVSTVEALVEGEFDSIAQEAGNKVAHLRRMHAWSTGQEVVCATGQRVDILEMRWLGNAQMKPTLLGYIEGAPPVPSENLTVESDYRGASTVEFKVSESSTTTFDMSLATGADLKMKAEVGAATNIAAGVALGVNAFEQANVLAVGQGMLDVSGRFTWDFARSGTTTHTTSEALSLKGARETTPQFPALGHRYVPKNVGYATVISSLADIFVLRLRASKRMVSYRVAPVKDVPPDINTVTFLINPNYTLNGSLDGQVGSQPADKQLYGHIPAARAQYGSAVEASYFRLHEAYALRDAIERSNRSIEALSVNLRSDLLEQTRQPATTNLSGSSDKNKEAAGKQSKQGMQTIASQKNKVTAAKPPSIDKLIAQTPKGNIVNSYVWDGDGGLRGQTQAFATSWKHVLGGSFSVDVGAGAKFQWNGFGAGFLFDFMVSAHLSMSFTNTTEKSRAMELNVGLSCENRDITDNQDRPLHPGEKVDRYRFMSFALQASTHHFNDFFDRVVDPVWLRSNDEEAVLLRQLDRTKPNQAWRVLHRVTFVERPSTGGT